MTWHIQRLDSCTSTMDVARERAHAGAPDGTVVVANTMTMGRGLHGHPWHAPRGGLYLSVVLRGVGQPHLLTLALGNAVADALEVAGVEPRLKWVNDVLVGGKKVGGILVEAESTGAAIDFLVAGIGINAAGDLSQWPEEVRSLATTLDQELGCETCLPDLEGLLLDQVGKWVQRVRDGDDAGILAAWRARDALHQQAVTVEDAEARFKGTAAGIDDAGHLLVDVPGRGRVTVTAGRVRPV